MKLALKSNLSDHEPNQSGIIPNVQIARAGIAKGHRVIKTADGYEVFDSAKHPAEAALQVVLDQQTLASIVRCASASRNGIKCVMNHSDDIVEVAGIFRNFRIEGDAVRADLHLLKASRHHEYLLELARECPEEFGVSINFYTSYSQIAPTNANLVVACLCEKLVSCDLVTEPAATDGLFQAKRENFQTTMDTEETTPEAITPEQIATIAGEAAAAAVTEAIAPLTESLAALNERMSKLETPPEEEKKKELSEEEKEAEQEEKMAKLAAKVASEIIVKLGVKQSVAASIDRNAIDLTKLNFSEHIAHIRKTEGKNEMDATREVMQKFPSKHQDHLASLKK